VNYPFNGFYFTKLGNSMHSGFVLSAEDTFILFSIHIHRKQLLPCWKTRLKRL